MAAITKPDGQLMNEVVEKLGLTTKEKNVLKDKEVILFVDSYDEWFINRNRNIELFNLYTSNHLSQEWPHLRLVIMVRRDFLSRGIKDYFTPDIGKKKEVLVAPFMEDDVTLYLSKYLEVRNKRDPFIHHPPVKWTDPNTYISHIKSLALWDVAANPFSLKILCDTLPGIVARHQKKELLEKLKVSKEDLFDEFLCQRFRKEFERQSARGKPIKSMLEYLDFALNLSRNMQFCQSHSIFHDSTELDALKMTVSAYIQEEKRRIKTLEEKESNDNLQNENKKDIEAAQRNIDVAQEAPDKLWDQLF